MYAKTGFAMNTVGWRITPVVRDGCVVTTVDPSYQQQMDKPPQEQLAVVAFHTVPKITAEGIDGDPQKDAEFMRFGHSSVAGGFLLETSNPEYASFEITIPPACAGLRSVWIIDR